MYSGPSALNFQKNTSEKGPFVFQRYGGRPYDCTHETDICPHTFFAWDSFLYQQVRKYGDLRITFPLTIRNCG